MCSEIKKGFTFTWKIKNFSLYCQRNGLLLKSQVIPIRSLGRSEWSLFVYPRRSVGPDPENYLVCLLGRCNDSLKEILHIDYTIEVIGENGPKLKPFSFKNQSFKSKQFSPLMPIVKTDEFISAMNSWSSDTFTVHCFMKNAKADEIIKYEALLSTVYYVSNVIDWNVNCNFLYSNEINIKNLWFSLKFILKASDESIHISVVISEITSSVLVKSKIWLLDVKGDEYDSGEDEQIFESLSDTRVWNFPHFLTKSRLKSSQLTFIENGTFKLRCLLLTSPIIQSKNSEEHVKNKISTVESTSNVDIVASLQSDLMAMFRDKKHSDVKLKVDNQLFFAHKNILAARSPVFSAMFDQDMVETRTGIIDVKDVNATVLELFLQFLYTNSLCINDSNQALDLLGVANKYQVQFLIENCSLFLSTHLSNENVCEILFAADLIGHRFLKKKCLDYIKTNASIILKQQEWSKLTDNNIKLATEVIAELVERF